MSIRSRKTRAGRAYDVRLRGPDGREVSRTFRTRREAVAYEASQRTALARGGWLDPKRGEVTVAAVAEEWLGSNVAKRSSTWARDESALRVHVLPHVGAWPLVSLTPADVRDLVGRWALVMGPRSVRRVYGTFRAVMAFAVDSDRLARTPCHGIRLPAVEPRRVRVVTADELAGLAESMGDSFSLMVWFGGVLGLRWGEVAGLRVGAVDLARRTVVVVEQVTRGRGGVPVLSAPKSAAGRRILTMPGALAGKVAAHLARRGLTAADADAFLFCNMKGGPLDYSKWRRRTWLPACRAAGLEGLGFHDLRRANATAMVRANVDLKTAQVRLGHSDPRLTLAIYAQATTEGDEEAAERLGARLMTPIEEPTPAEAKVPQPTARGIHHSSRGMDAGCPRTGQPGKAPKKGSDQPIRESGRRDLNPRPQRPERCALTKLRYFPLVEAMLPDGPAQVRRHVRRPSQARHPSQARPPRLTEPVLGPLPPGWVMAGRRCPHRSRRPGLPGWLPAAGSGRGA